MNTFRKILNNLQKYATSVTPVKNDIKAVTPLLSEKQSLEDTHLDKETEFQIGVKTANSQTIDTRESLKEFDNILEEINKDVTVGASLDDIDDVLNDMVQEDPKDFMFEVPKFDLAEISAAYGNLKDDDIYETNSLISLDESFVSFSDIYIPNSNEDIEQDDVISISSEDSSTKGSGKNISTENIKKNIHEDSMNTEETKAIKKHSQSIDCETVDDKYISAEKDEGIAKQANFHVETNLEQNMDIDSMNAEETEENIKHSEIIECEKLDNKYISAEKDERIEKQANFNVETNLEENIDIDSMNTEEIIKLSESFECEKLYNKLITAEKVQGIEKQTNVHVATKELHVEKTNEPTDKTKELIQSNPVESCKEENDLITKDVVLMNDSDDVGYQSSDFEFITEEEAKMNGFIINLKKNTHKRKTTEVNRVKNTEIAVDQFFNANRLRRNKMKLKTRIIDKDPDWAPESDTDSTSDDEFIPDDMEYLRRNNTRSKNNNTHGKSPERNITDTFRLRQIRIPHRRYNGAPRFRNLQINSESLTARNVNEYNVDVRQNNEESDGPSRYNFRGFSNECRNEIATMKMEANDQSNLCKTETGDIELAQIYPIEHFKPDLPEKVPDSFKDIPGSSFMQDIHPESNKIITNEMEDRPELNSIATLKCPEINTADPGPSQSQSPEGNKIPGNTTENVPDPKIMNPGPSGMQEVPKLVNIFPAGPSCKRNRSHVDEIEKWRMYQMRNRLNRPQFVVDYSYRDHHRIFENNDLHQLFDPNRAPLPTARSMRLLENKSTVCKNSMLVEYQGVGFNVQLRRDSGSEDDEAKREANECAQKILEMYPGQNTRRRRQRRF